MYMLHRDVAPSHVDVARCAILQGDIDLYKSTTSGGKSSRSIASVDSHASYYDGLGKKSDSSRLSTYLRDPNEKVELFSHSQLNVRAVALRTMTLSQALGNATKVARQGYSVKSKENSHSRQLHSLSTYKSKKKSLYLKRQHPSLSTIYYLFSVDRVRNPGCANPG